MGFSKRKYSFLFLKKGSILVISIWILAIFSILNISLYKMVSSYLKVVKRMRETAISRYLAKSASLYIQETLKEDETYYDTLYEINRPKEVKLEGGKFVFSLIDEESKININKAPLDVLANLPGLDEEIAKKIKNFSPAPFYFKEELLIVEGINEEIFSKIKDLITVYGNGRVNINTAKAEVLKALGFDNDLVRIIEEFRKGADGEELTEDDGIFENVHSIIDNLRSFTPLYEKQEAIILERISQGLLGVSSENYLAQIETYFLGEKKKFEILLTTEKIKKWQEF